MKFKLIKDRYYRNKFSKSEAFQNVLKFLKFYCSLNTSLMNNYYYKYIFYIINSFNFIPKTKIKNRCLFTNNSRSILRKYKVSRNYLRLILQFGLLSGYKKVSW